MSRRADIELAVVSRLQPLTRAAGRYLACLAQYNGELDGADDLKAALLGRAPGVLVTTSGASGETKGLRRAESRVMLNIELVVVSNHLRSRVAQKTGDAALAPTADPGSYQMLEDIQRRLHGHRLVGLEGVELLTWESDGVIVQAPELTAWRQVFTTRYRLAALEPAAQPLESIEHRHNLDQAAPVNPVVVAELEVQS